MLRKLNFNENWDVSLVAKYFVSEKELLVGMNTSWAGLFLGYSRADRYNLSTHPLPRSIFFFLWMFYLLLILCQKIQGQMGTCINPFICFNQICF